MRVLCRHGERPPPSLITAGSAGREGREKNVQQQFMDGAGPVLDRIDVLCLLTVKNHGQVWPEARVSSGQKQVI